MRIQNALVVLFVEIAAAVIGMQSQRESRPLEQRHFSAEEEAVGRPVPLPKDVFRDLKSDDGVVRVQES
jgi:hypothetical protein